MTNAHCRKSFNLIRFKYCVLHTHWTSVVSWRAGQAAPLSPVGSTSASNSQTPRPAGHYDPLCAPESRCTATILSICHTSVASAALKSVSERGAHGASLKRRYWSARTAHLRIIGNSCHIRVIAAVHFYIDTDTSHIAHATLTVVALASTCHQQQQWLLAQRRRWRQTLPMILILININEICRQEIATPYKP